MKEFKVGDLVQWKSTAHKDQWFTITDDNGDNTVFLRKIQSNDKNAYFALKQNLIKKGE